MKKLTPFIIALTLLVNIHAHTAEQSRSLLEKLFNKDLPGGAASREMESSKTPKEIQKATNKPCKKVGERSLLEKALKKDLPGGNAKKNINKNCSSSNQQVKIKTNKNNRNLFDSNDTSQQFTAYTGTFDTIDKEGDDQTTLVGLEHKNKNLFRNTWIGRFSPTTGAFLTKKSSIYLYTGIEADYNLGPIKISPSFAPGYYEAGNGKNLGSALEFKSEVKIGIDLFKGANLGYSYSHISNNDWGDTNPGTDNQSLTFSKNF
jgi:lipid A 3-O-deacylase